MSLKNPANRDRAVGFTQEQWQYVFTNGFSDEESRRLITEVKEFPGPHLLPSWPGWEKVADYALDWTLTHARPCP